MKELCSKCFCSGVSIVIDEDSGQAVCEYCRGQIIINKIESVTREINLNEIESQELINLHVRIAKENVIFIIFSKNF